MSKVINADKIIEANSPLRKAHFMAQCHHESMGLRRFEENLNYSAERLIQVFPKYFIDMNIALDYEYDKTAIGNRIYMNRMGNEDRGDGYKYRGRGALQLTGRNNYKAFGKYIGYDTENDPDVVTLAYPLESAAWFFTENNLWDICDLGISRDIIKKLTKRINGGYNGLEDRIKLTKMYYDKYK